MLNHAFPAACFSHSCLVLRASRLNQLVTIFSFSTFKLRSISQDFSSYKTLNSFLPCSGNICKLVVCQLLFRVMFLADRFCYFLLQSNHHHYHLITSSFLAFARTSTSPAQDENKVTPVNVEFNRFSVNHSSNECKIKENIQQKKAKNYLQYILLFY